jgi:hypothetical protein
MAAPMDLGHVLLDGDVEFGPTSDETDITKYPPSELVSRFDSAAGILEI